MTFPCLLWILFGVTVAGPVKRATGQTRSEGKYSLLTGHDGAELRPSFLHLPTFHHAPHPLVAPELFRPLSHKRHLPDGLRVILLPPKRHSESVLETRGRAVDVSCGVDKVSVRVDRFQLRTWTVPSLFRLGSCQPSKTSPRFLYFHYGLLECDGEAKVIDGQLVYSHLLTYTPPPQDYVLRSVPLNLPIQCQYNRFHYSYKVGFIPQLQQTTFMKNLKTKLSFSLTVCNAQWEPLPTGHWFFLGEQVYFMAQSSTLLTGERLYVDACYATSSSEQNGTPQLEIISNLGCMTDSRREGSNSHFLSREANVVKFSVDAFLFKAISQMLYLHCSMVVGLTTSIKSKSCNYNKAAGRWEELEAHTSVCSCCDSMCADSQHSVRNAVSSPGWFIGRKSEQSISFQAEDGRNRVNKEEKGEEKLDENLKDQMKTEVSHLEEKDEIMSLSAKKDTWRHSNAVSWWETKDKDDTQVLSVHSSVEEEASDGNIMSDQSRIQEKEADRQGVFRSKHYSVSGGSSDNSSSNPLEVSFATSSGFDKKVSSAANHVINPCTNGDESCSVTRGAIRPEGASKHAAHSTTNNVIAESFAAFSAGEVNVNESLFDERLESRTLTHPVTGNLKIYLPGFSHARKLVKSKHEPGMLKACLRLEQLKPVNKPESTKQAAHFFSSKGTDGYEDVLHGVQIRELESEHSANPTEIKDSICIDGSLCESDFDSGIKETKALHLSQFTGAVKTQRGMHNISKTIPRKCSASSGSASSEKMHQDNPTHSTGGAAATQQGFMSHYLAEAMPRWFAMKQPTESFDGWWWWRTDHKHRIVYAGAQ